jgi:hypothetical protein
METIQTKCCTKCGVEKPLNHEHFHKHNRRVSGFREICRTCVGSKLLKGESRRISISNNQKKCTKCKEIKVLTEFRKRKQYVNSSCKSCEKEELRIYRLNNKEKIQEASRKRLAKKKQDPLFRKQLTEKKRIYKNRKKQEDPIYKMKLNISKLILESIRRYGWGKESKTFELLGCDWKIFKSHIENQFVDGMTWENHGQFGWHFDHIKPISSGKTQDEINKLNHYTNFQPLWWYDNLRKSDKLPEEFMNA